MNKGKLDKGNLVMTLVMLSIFVGMVGVATQYSPQARFMPFVFGIPGILLCLFQLFSDFRASRRVQVSAPADTRNEFEIAQAKVSGMVGQEMQFDMATEQLQTVVTEQPEEGEVRREIILWACLIGLVASIILFGFWISIPVFIALFLHFFAGKGWKFSLGLSALGTSLLYLIFAKGLGVVLHGGFIMEALQERFM